MERHAGWLVPLLWAALSACGEPPDYRVVALQQCQALRVQGQVELTFVAGEPALVRLSGESQAVADAEVVEGADLTTIRGGPHPLAVVVSCQQLRQLELIGAVNAELALPAGSVEKIGVYGSSRMYASGAGGEQVMLRVAGAGQLHLTQLIADEIAVQAAGDARVVLTGEADDASFEVAGTSQVDASGLPAQRVMVRLRGNTHTTVHAGAHLGGSVGEGAELSYTGSPDVSLQRLPAASP